MVGHNSPPLSRQHPCLVVLYLPNPAISCPEVSAVSLPPSKQSPKAEIPFHSHIVYFYQHGRVDLGEPRSSRFEPHLKTTALLGFGFLFLGFFVFFSTKSQKKYKFSTYIYQIISVYFLQVVFIVGKITALKVQQYLQRNKRSFQKNSILFFKKHFYIIE